MAFWVKLRELEQYVKYEIDSFSIEDTPIGIEEVVIYFPDGGHAYLPNRFMELSADEIDDLNKMDISIMRTGTRECTFDPMADFLFFSNSEESSAFKKLNELNLQGRPYVDWHILRRDKVFKVKFEGGYMVRFQDGNFAKLPGNLQQKIVTSNTLEAFVKVLDYGLEIVDEKEYSVGNIYECCYESLN